MHVSVQKCILVKQQWLYYIKIGNFDLVGQPQAYFCEEIAGKQGQFNFSNTIQKIGIKPRYYFR